MRDFSTTVSIAASPAVVWRVLAEVDNWPQWTKSVTSVQRLNQSALSLGSKVRIEQPKLKPAVWTVTDWDSERLFTWVSTSPGVAVTAGHQVVRTSEGCDVTLTIHFGGMLGGLVGLIAGRLTREYMAMEATGLKHRAETMA